MKTDTSSKSTTDRRMLLVDSIACDLRKRIAEGFYAPESLMPPERQLAREFGVGRSTVSSALSILAKENLVEQTRGRGTYVLATGKRLPFGRIGVAYELPSLRPNLTPEPALILRGIEDTFSRLGYEYDLVPVLREGSHHATPPPPDQCVHTATIPTLADRYSALITIELLNAPEKILELDARNVILVVANLERDMDLTATCTDHRKAFRGAVELLAAQGHRRIALVTRDPSQFHYGRASEGYLMGLKTVGIPRDDSLIIECDETCALSAYLAARPLIESSARPTAIIASRDIMAKGVCRAITEAKLEIGRDISVIGFDDISWEAENPYLTTFREPTYEMGALAAEMLADRIVHGRKPHEQREIESPLILRRSVGPPPGAALSGDNKSREVVFPSAAQTTPR